MLKIKNTYCYCLSFNISCWLNISLILLTYVIFIQYSLNIFLIHPCIYVYKKPLFILSSHDPLMTLVMFFTYFFLFISFLVIFQDTSMKNFLLIHNFHIRSSKIIPSYYNFLFLLRSENILMSYIKCRCTMNAEFELFICLLLDNFHVL